MKYNSIVFECYKCGHKLHVPKEKLTFLSLLNISKKDCFECGEEGEIWKLIGGGRYEKDKK